MTRTELNKLDAHIWAEFDAKFIGIYGDDESDSTVRVYTNPRGRILVEVFEDKWALFTHHESGGAS